VTSPRCICGCRGPAAHRHHVVTKEEIKKAWRSLHRASAAPAPELPWRSLLAALKDERNLVPMRFECHGAHHRRQQVLPLRVLPDSVFEFARDLMGGGPAFVWLARTYAGDDPRLDALLENEEAA
jgi:hypothetical protein